MDLALINQEGNGRPVPPEMDMNIIKYIIGQRIEAVQKNKSIFELNRWDHSEVFYKAEDVSKPA